MQKIVSKIARRDKKSFFSECCIDIEENNKRGMTRDFFRKIGNIKGTLHPKMGTKKNRNGRALVDAEEIKERCLRVLMLLLLLSCFHVLTIVNSAAMNIRMHVFFQTKGHLGALFLIF